MPEGWQYNPILDLVKTLDGCQFGLEVDERCNALLCKFRIEKHLAPEKIHPMSMMCPREQEHECEQAAVICRD